MATIVLLFPWACVRGARTAAAHGLWQGTRMEAPRGSPPKATALSPLDPKRAPVRVLDCCSRDLRVRVPEDDAVMETMVAAAHAAALAAGEDEYDNVMEDFCSRLITDRPAYWAQLWPSAVALATKLLLEPSLVAERRVLEVGSGLGLVSAAAAMAGAASVIATDREPDALEYARANAEENGVEDQVRAPAAPPQARLGT